MRQNGRKRPAPGTRGGSLDLRAFQSEQKKVTRNGTLKSNYNPQIEMFARFKMKSSFHKTKRII